MLTLKRKQEVQNPGLTALHCINVLFIIPIASLIPVPSLEEILRLSDFFHMPVCAKSYLRQSTLLIPLFDFGEVGAYGFVWQIASPRFMEE